MILTAVAIPAAAIAQDTRPDFDPGALKGPRNGDPERVMVLGSPHLSGLPATVRPADLQPLLDRLASFRPQAIAVEDVSGPQCDFMRRYPDRYADTIKSYCWDPAPARAATGLDVAAATQETERLLAHWPAAPTAAERRRLTALFLASGEQASALVQWLRLPEAERRAGDGLDAALVARLTVLQARRDESLMIGAALAARIGLERIHAMDDHTADAPTPDEAAYGAAIAKAWDNPAGAKRKAMDDALYAKLGTPGALLALYRAYNAPGMGRLVFDSDFGAALEEPSPQHFGRAYLGYWETRNLRMAANIREVLQPGMRALVIVGASHKGYLEAYLDRMHDVRIVDADAVLK